MILCQHTTNSLGLEKAKEFFLIRHIWACGITKGIATASIVLLKESFDFRIIRVRKSKLHTHTLMPHFRKSLCALDTQYMQVQIFCVLIALEE